MMAGSILWSLGTETRGQIPENRLYKNNGGKFENVLIEGGLLDKGDHGVEWVDYDRDGDIDLSVTDGYGTEGGHFLFRNDLEFSANKKMLSVLVLDKDENFTRAGSEIRVYDTENNILGSRQVSSGGGYNTQSALPVYFGIFGHTSVSIEIKFMGLSGGHIQRLENIELINSYNQIIVVEDNNIQ